MLALHRLWRWWTESWQTPRRARALYLALAVGFTALSVVAAFRGDAAVAVIAGLLVLVTTALAAFAPWLAERTGRARGLR